MFTGIIHNFAKITKLERSEILRFAIEVDDKNFTTAKGNSIALNGICLTVISFDNQQVWFEVSLETVNKTTISKWKIDDLLHLELALMVSDRFDGHFVLGHIDTTLKIENAILNDNQTKELTISLEGLEKSDKKMIVTKGSIAIDGVSLTINSVSDNNFSLMLIPYTLKKTNLGKLRKGDLVNVEFDVLARYSQNHQ